MTTEQRLDQRLRDLEGMLRAREAVRKADKRLQKAISGASRSVVPTDDADRCS